MDVVVGGLEQEDVCRVEKRGGCVADFFPKLLVRLETELLLDVLQAGAVIRCWQELVGDQERGRWNIHGFIAVFNGGGFIVCSERGRW